MDEESVGSVEFILPHFLPLLGVRHSDSSVEQPSFGSVPNSPGSSMAASEEGKQEVKFFEVIPPSLLLTLYPL